MVLHACALSEDIHFLPSGDLTYIGDSGVTLSGGQKARVALARAVYQDKSIYILDDIISAVDKNVARHIFQHCILGILSNKTRILCTHYTQYLVHCEWLVMIEDGTVSKQGQPIDVLVDYDEFILPNDAELLLETSSESDAILKTSKVEISTTISNQETSEIGSVEFDVYASYWKAVGHLLSVSILIAIVLMQTSRNMTDWWLSYWVSNSEPQNETTNASLPTPGEKYVLWMPNLLIEKDRNINFYMGIYGTFVGVNTLFTLFRAFLFAYGGVTAAMKIHKTLLKVIMKVFYMRLHDYVSKFLLYFFRRKLHFSIYLLLVEY